MEKRELWFTRDRNSDGYGNIAVWDAEPKMTKKENTRWDWEEEKRITLSTDYVFRKAPARHAAIGHPYFTFCTADFGRMTGIRLRQGEMIKVTIEVPDEVDSCTYVEDD